MNEKKLLLGMLLFTIAIIGGIVLVAGKSSSPPSVLSQNVEVQTDQVSYDWGNIPYSGGNATKTFKIKNSGTDVLKLYNVKTSCHCTRARVAINGTNSPDFGMDSFSSWAGEVTRGGEAALTVIFDPTYHGPQGVGPVNRFVSVETNDPAHSKLTFTLTGIVVK